MIDQIWAIESLPYGRFILPPVFLGFTYLVAKLLRFPWALVLMLGSAAFAVPYINHPFAEDLSETSPLLLIVGTWAVLIAVGLGYRLAKFAIQTTSSGGLSIVWLASGALSFIVALLCYFKPQVLSIFGSQAKGAFLIFALAVAFLSFLFSMIRLMRSGTALLVWGFVCLSLSSELFLNSVSKEYLNESLRNIPSFVPDFEELKESFDKLGASNRVKIGVLGGTLGLASSELETLLNLQGEQAKFEVVNLSRPDIGVQQYAELLKNSLSSGSADALIISQNYLGEPELVGLRPKPPAAWKIYASYIPLVRPIAESRTYNALLVFLGFSGKVDPNTEIPRLSPEQREQATQRIKTVLADKSITPFFVDELSYEEAGENEYFIDKKNLTPLGVKVAALSAFRSLVNDPGANASIKDLAQFPESQLTLIATKDTYAKDFLAAIDVPDDGRTYYQVAFGVNGRTTDLKRLVGTEETRVRFKIPKSYYDYPALRLTLRTASSPNDEDSLVSPTNLVAQADSAMISSGAESVKLKNSKGMLLATLDPKAGTIIDSLQVPAENQAPAANFVRRAAWGDILILAGNSPIAADLRASLRYAGLTPNSEEYYLGVGVAGKKSKIYENQSASGLSIRLGAERNYRSSRFKLLAQERVDSLKPAEPEVAPQIQQENTSPLE